MTFMIVVCNIALFFGLLNIIMYVIIPIIKQSIIQLNLHVRHVVYYT